MKAKPGPQPARADASAPPANLLTTMHEVSVLLGRGKAARTVINGVTLQFQPGEQVAIIGPSGAGKTTLLHTLACAIAPSSGKVDILGANPWKMSQTARHQWRKRLFLAPQSPPLPPRQRVVNAVLAARLPQWSLWQALASLYRPKEAVLAQSALARFKLEDKLWLRCDRLSGGERQRVALSRAIISGADLLLLDEPVSALDPVLGMAALKTLKDEAQRRGATLIVSLHDVTLAVAQFPRLIGLKGGQVHFDMPAARITDTVLADLYGAEFDAVLGSKGNNNESVAAEIPSAKLTRCF